ncbi:MAG: aminoacyl-tRNA hydrolase [Bryobacterales bacterium]|nr:aminoacyl-tRNA hydrolase [Acidobacteriota bacterium]MCB9385693.1 aminoacyl-tRNA hydrolase [Bryobacterales bacterium]
MHLIVGLGNPGPEYALTPHNLGFLTIDRLAEDAGIRVVRPEAGALVGRGEIAGKPVVLAKPLSYMNLSGGPVKKLLEKYELGPERLLVIVDELDLPWASMRLKPKGSAAGHNGMKSILGSLGTADFPRLRLGIHPGRPIGNGAQYVLRQFRSAEVKELEEILSRAADVVRLYLSDGAEKAMAVANRRADGVNNEEA